MMDYRGRNKPLTYGEGMLRTVNQIKKVLGDGRLHKLGFFVDEVITEQVVKLNRVEKEWPSASDVAKADDIELQEITESTMKSTEDLIIQFEGEETIPMRVLLGLDKQLRSIRGSLKVEVAKKVQLEERKAQKLKEL